jgi:hypothetical protein
LKKGEQSDERLRELETQNWVLRGDLAAYEIALRKMHDVMHRAQHILECHKDEVTWGALDADGTLKDRKLDALTRQRRETLEEVIKQCRDLCRTMPKPDEWPEVIE